MVRRGAAVRALGRDRAAGRPSRDGLSPPRRDARRSPRAGARADLGAGESASRPLCRATARGTPPLPPRPGAGLLVRTAGGYRVDTDARGTTVTLHVTHKYREDAR